MNNCYFGSPMSHTFPTIDFRLSHVTYFCQWNISNVKWGLQVLADWWFLLEMLSWNPATMLWKSSSSCGEANMEKNWGPGWQLQWGSHPVPAPTVNHGWSCWTSAILALTPQEPKLPVMWIRRIIHFWYCKPWNFGAVCYGAVDNWNKDSSAEKRTEQMKPEIPRQSQSR
jgi:hypothetical protein